MGPAPRRAVGFGDRPRARGVSRDDRYFRDKYQAMPVDGYTAMLKRHSGPSAIEVLLGVDYRDLPSSISFKPMAIPGQSTASSITFTENCRTVVYVLNLNH